MFDIVFGCDRSYVDHLVVTITSIYCNLPHPRDLRIWVLNEGISSAEQKRIAASLSSFGSINIRFESIDGSALAKAPISNHVSRATYYRLLIPEIIPREVSRVLYLDCDIIAEHDIREIFAADIRGRSIGAVSNPGFHRWDDLQMDRNAGYFNAGVMLIDMDKWRQNDVSGAALELIRTIPGKLLNWDQDALNIALQGAWAPLEPHWNQQSSFFGLGPHGSEALGYAPIPWRSALEVPRIIHYSTSSKPWHFANDHPFKARYHHYRKIAGLGPIGGRPTSWRGLLVRMAKVFIAPRHRENVQRFFGKVNDRSKAREHGK
jgi:lipopolysaccharide biosynthesis glycosyltransferase